MFPVDVEFISKPTSDPALLMTIASERVRVVSTVVVVPDTVKFPATVTAPLEAIAIAAGVVTEPMFPAFGITIFPPVVSNPVSVVAPVTPKVPATAIFVASFAEVTALLSSCVTPTLASATFVVVERKV